MRSDCGVVWRLPLICRSEREMGAQSSDLIAASPTSKIRQDQDSTPEPERRRTSQTTITAVVQLESALLTLDSSTMSFQRLGLRLAQQTTRSSPLRSHLVRRFASTEAAAPKLPQPGDKLVGAADNAFNRERAAVKAHAAATSGE